MQSSGEQERHSRGANEDVGSRSRGWCLAVGGDELRLLRVLLGVHLLAAGS